MPRLVSLGRAAVLAGALTAILAGGVLAGPPDTGVRHDQFSFGFTDDWTCSETIDVWFDVSRNATAFFDSNGYLTRLVIDVTYRGTFTNASDPTLSVQSPGHRHIVLDFVKGIFTDSGLYRSATTPADGLVLLEAGRIELDLDTTSIVLFMAGPHEDWYGDYAAFCAALGG